MFMFERLNSVKISVLLKLTYHQYNSNENQAHLLNWLGWLQNLWKWNVTRFGKTAFKQTDVEKNHLSHWFEGLLFATLIKIVLYWCKNRHMKLIRGPRNRSIHMRITYADPQQKWTSAGKTVFLYGKTKINLYPYLILTVHKIKFK